MKRRTLLAAGGGALVALGAGYVVSRPDPVTELLSEGVAWFLVGGSCCRRELFVSQAGR